MEKDQAGDDSTFERLELAIPPDLRRIKCWLVWRIGEPDGRGKRAKYPYYVTGTPRSGVQGSEADVAQLGTFDQAIARLRMGGFTGVGIATLERFRIVAIDFDNCVYAGKVDKRVEDVIDAAKTYTELSPSGTGIRMLMRGAMRSGKNHDIGGGVGCEVFGTSGFVTLTGNLKTTDPVEELSPAVEIHLLKLLGENRHKQSKSEQLSEVKSTDPTYLRLAALNLVEHEYTDGRIAVTCPFEDEHTTPGGTADTVYFLPHTHGFSSGHFKCMHAHCDKRTDEEFKNKIGVIDINESVENIVRRATGSDTDGFVDLGTFAKQASAPSYTIESVLRRGYLYSLTGFSNSGKTSIGLAMGVAITRGDKFGPHETTKGKVLILAGENPEDVRFRVMACAQERIEPVETFAQGAYVLPYRFAIGKGIEYIKEFAERVGGLAFILIDSKAAYFAGDKEDDNVQALAQAHEARRLTQCAGNPTVVMIAHPAKHVSDQASLTPRGGSAFLNEIDGNLTAWKDGEVTELWWNKIRGFHWDAIQIQLVVWKLLGMTTERGTPITSVIAKPVLNDEPERIASESRSKEDTLLCAMLANPKASISQLAAVCGWLSDSGEPMKSKVDRVLKSLQRDRLVHKPRASGGYVLTAKGKTAAQAAVADGVDLRKK